jgi:hypothetical protein
LFQIGLFSSVEETEVSLRRKSCLLEAGASSTLFPFENWVSFCKEYFLQIRIFKVETGSFCGKWAYSPEWIGHMYLSKENHLY